MSGPPPQYSNPEQIDPASCYAIDPKYCDIPGCSAHELKLPSGEAELVCLPAGMSSSSREAAALEAARQEMDPQETYDRPLGISSIKFMIEREKARNKLPEEELVSRFVDSYDVERFEGFRHKGQVANLLKDGDVENKENALARRHVLLSYLRFLISANNSVEAGTYRWASLIPFSQFGSKDTPRERKLRSLA